MTDSTNRVRTDSAFSVRALRGSKHHADPNQVISHGGGSCAFFPTVHDVICQLLAGQLSGILVADRMPLEEFKCGLLGPPPIPDRLERVDVPADDAF